MRVERLGDATLYEGDALAVLRSLPESSVHCIMTSPPYWGLRKYGGYEMQTLWGSLADFVRPKKHTQRWWIRIRWRAAERGGIWSANRRSWIGALGMEPTLDLYVQHVVQVFREARRVLRADGTCWINFGDSYAGGGRAGSNPEYMAKHKMFGKSGWDPGVFGLPQAVPTGLKPKDMCGVPWRVAFALQADGWYLRSDIIWAKPNPMPESVTDRPTKAHEYLFLLSKAPRYFYDAEAIREEDTTTRPELLAFGERPDVNYPGHVNDRRRSKKPNGWDTSIGNGGHGEFHKEGRRSGNKERKPGADTILGASHVGRGFPWEGNSRNRRTVWTIATQPFPEAHFATFPEKLVEPCVLAGCPAQTCPECGAPWERTADRQFVPQPDVSAEQGIRCAGNHKPMDASNSWGGSRRGHNRVTTTGFRPTCACGRENTVSGTFLDLFCGSGTALLVALKLGRRAAGIELKPEYAQMAARRLRRELGMFAEAVS